jgi:CARDB
MIRNALLGAAVFVAGFSAAGVAAAAGPDLVPIPSRIDHGTVSVRNVGDAPSGPSVVTINCSKPPLPGGCAEIPAAFMPNYTNPAYPNRLTVQVPALAAGRVFNHRLPFWPRLAWASGTYHFNFVADAGNAVAESNEGNNAGLHIKVVP